MWTLSSFFYQQHSGLSWFLILLKITPELSALPGRSAADRWETLWNNLRVPHSSTQLASWTRLGRHQNHMNDEEHCYRYQRTNRFAPGFVLYSSSCTRVTNQCARCINREVTNNRPVVLLLLLKRVMNKVNWTGSLGGNRAEVWRLTWKHRSCRRSPQCNVWRASVCRRDPPGNLTKHRTNRSTFTSQ